MNDTDNRRTELKTVEAEQKAKYKAAEAETTHRSYGSVFFHAFCVTQREVAFDAQIRRS